MFAIIFNSKIEISPNKMIIFIKDDHYEIFSSHQITVVKHCPARSGLGGWPLKFKTLWYWCGLVRLMSVAVTIEWRVNRMEGEKISRRRSSRFNLALFLLAQKISNRIEFESYFFCVKVIKISFTDQLVLIPQIYFLQMPGNNIGTYYI